MNLKKSLLRAALFTVTFIGVRIATQFFTRQPIDIVSTNMLAMVVGMVVGSIFLAHDD